MALLIKIVYSVLTCVTIFVADIFVSSAPGNLNTYKIELGDHTKTVLGYPEEANEDFVERTQKRGYLTEQHEILTEDGYILTLFHMTSKECKAQKRTPIFLLHALFQGAESYLDVGPERGLAYLLANACFDLWVGNDRGNGYSRKHSKLDPDRDEEFWIFSLDEMGFYDVPANVAFILDTTGADNINLIGFSQGGAACIIMCAERPEFCVRVNLIIAYAPTTKLTHTKSPLFRLIAEGSNKLESILDILGTKEVLFKGSVTQTTLEFLCDMRQVLDTPKVECSGFLYLLDSYHPGAISEYTSGILYSNFPFGTSLNNIKRYGQAVKSDNFQKYDFGKEKNLEVYGSEGPPVYDLSKVEPKVLILHGDGDNLADRTDILWLAEQLPNQDLIIMSDPLWNHFDFVYNDNNSEVVDITLDNLIKYD